MRLLPYDRNSAVNYAKKWALKRNPAYYDFESIGGDCTNFVSQCIYAGSKVMNFTKDIGWYYSDINNRAAAWTSVEYLYSFLTSNSGAGPFGISVTKSQLKKGDIIQLGTFYGDFYHSLIVSDFYNHIPIVCAHTFDALNKPLNEYFYETVRYIHIENVRK